MRPRVSAGVALPVVLLLCHLLQSVEGVVSSMNYVPLGNNPTLYTPGFEPVMHLDQATFSDTVFGTDHAYVVEFYADWCGHCRAFAPFYRRFAELVSNWQGVVTVAAINCADAFNQAVCRDNQVTHFPMLKYFARTSRSASQGLSMDTPHSAEAMRDTLLRNVLNEYAHNRYWDWPLFSHLHVDSRTTYGNLWEGVAESANYLVIFFEQFDGLGAQFLLDLLPHRHLVGARRALSTSPLVQMLQITSFPTVALFERNHQQALYSERFGEKTYNDVLSLVNSGRALQLTTRAPFIATTAPPVVDCNRYPDRCRDMYFVSETDMLKAMRMALYDEVLRAPQFIVGENFTNLHNFVGLLSLHFPVLSFNSESSRRAVRSIRRRAATSTILKNSERARFVFSHLKEFLDQRQQQRVLSVDEWKRQFDNIERVYSHPFPTNSSWQHCQGTTPMFRGYTCGLWTTFHALTVHTFIDTIKDDHVDPLRPLLSIQGWVKSFFGCEHCKNHFMHMTTSMFPMNERRVRYSHDMMTYLWRAHNIVNNRLHGDPTEDPQFTKMQFPAPFLCPTCHSGGQFSRRQVRNFLVRYYGSIQPHNRLQNRRLRLK